MLESSCVVILNGCSWVVVQVVVQAPVIKGGSQATILFGDKEVMSVTAWLTLGWRNRFYGSFHQQIFHFGVQDMCVLALHWKGNHLVETWGSPSELKWIASFYYPQNPLWHSGDGLPCLSPGRQGLDWLECLIAARGHGTREKWKRKNALILKLFVFYFDRYDSVSPLGCLNGPRVCSKHIFDFTQNLTEWLMVYERQLGGWFGCSETWPPPLSDP